MKDLLKKVYFLTISVFLFHCSMNIEDKVLLDKEQIIDSNFSQSFVKNFNKNKNFSSSYNIFFSEEIDEKIISSFMKGIEFGFFSNKNSIKSKLSFIAFNESSDCNTIKAKGFNLVLVNDLNSEFYRKCKKRLSRNSLFTSIDLNSDIEFTQTDEKFLLITGKNRNSKNNESVLSLKNSSDYEQKIADYFEIKLSNERARSLRNVLKEKRIIPAIRYNLIFDAEILTYPKSIDVWSSELSLSELNKVKGFEYPVLLNRMNIFEKIIPEFDVNEKIAFSAGFDIFFFGTKIKGRSSSFSGLLGRYEINENFLYSKPLKFSINPNGVKQG
jgi:hypothetical protein